MSCCWSSHTVFYTLCRNATGTLPHCVHTSVTNQIFQRKKNMYRPLTAVFALALSMSAHAAAPEYVTIKMEIDVAKPAKEVWAKVGSYCDIGKWAKGLDCEIVSGDGGIGTVRSLAKGRIKEILVGKTDLSYGYDQPAVEG